MMRLARIEEQAQQQAELQAFEVGVILRVRWKGCTALGSMSML